MKSLQETARYSNLSGFRKFSNFYFGEILTRLSPKFMLKKNNLFFKFAFSRKNLTEIHLIWQKKLFSNLQFQEKSYWKIVGKAVIRHLPVKTGEVVISTTPTLMSKSFDHPANSFQLGLRLWQAGHQGA